MKFNFKKVRNGESDLEHYSGYLPFFIRSALGAHKGQIWRSTLKKQGIYDEINKELTKQRTLSKHKKIDMAWHAKDLLNWLDKNPEYKKFITISEE